MIRRISSLFAAFVLSGAGSAFAATPDIPKARAEIVSLLQDLVKIDSRNPPGNESKVAEYLKALFEREGIPAEIVALEAGRGNVIARLKGSGRKKPLLLMGHEDTVGIEREKWTMEPFAAILKDGYLYGRGSADDKAMVATNAIVFLTLHRMKVPLDRDVIFLAEAGEEGTAKFGVEFVVDKHWDKIACEYALNEGGTTRTRDGKVAYVGVATTEKIPAPIRLVARGTSGHGSAPRMDNAIVHLAAAVAKVGAWETPMRLSETTRAFFQRLATISAPADADLYRHLLDPATAAEAQKALRKDQVFYYSMLRTSISPNIIKGGFRQNVIPAEAEATLDVRALQDENLDELAASLRKLIDDPAVEVISSKGERPAGAPSPLDSDLFKALERSQARVFPGSITLPQMVTGATDSAQLRAKGVKAYGVGMPESDEDSRRVHGNDERVEVEGLGRFFDFLWSTVVEVAGAR